MMKAYYLNKSDLSQKSLQEYHQNIFNALAAYIEQGDTETNYYEPVMKFIDLLFIPKETLYLEGRDQGWGMEYGDTIRHSFLNYRNDGVYLYDGNESVRLASKPDEYGTAPMCFPAVTQFPLMYFDESITHNRYIWMPKGVYYRDSLKDYEVGSGVLTEVDKAFEYHPENFEVELYENVKYDVYIILKPSLYPQTTEDEYIYVVVLYTQNYGEKRDEAVEKLLTTGTYLEYFGPNVAILNCQTYIDEP